MILFVLTLLHPLLALQVLEISLDHRVEAFFKPTANQLRARITENLRKLQSVETRIKRAVRNT